MYTSSLFNYRQFLWEWYETEQYYIVYNLQTGFSLKAIPVKRRVNQYTVENDTEKSKNFYGQEVDKIYTKYQLMDKLKQAGGNEQWVNKC